MPIKSKLRSFSRLAGYSLLGVAAVLLTNRWWIPALLPTFLERYDVHVESIEHTDEGGYQLQHVRIQNPRFELSIDQLVTPSWFQYVWERWNLAFSDASSVRLGSISVRLKATETEPSSEAVYLPDLLDQVERAIAAIEPWLPPIAITQIEILDATKQPLARLKDVEVNDQHLHLQVTTPALPEMVELQTTFPHAGAWSLSLSSPELSLSGHFNIQNRPTNTQITGNLLRLESTLELSASFSNERWRPTAAHATTERFNIPVKWVPTTPSTELTRLEVNNLNARWDGSDYRISGSASAEATDASATQLDGRASLSIAGNLDQLRILEGTLHSDWATLHLSDPVGIQFADKSLQGDAQLSTQVELSRLPWLDATGQVQATLTVQPTRPTARVAFSLRADALSYQDQTLQELTATGWFDFNSIHITELRASPNGLADHTDRLELSGTVDWANSVADLKINALLTHDWLNEIIGQPLFVEPLTIEQGTLTGWIDQPLISAQFKTSVETPQIERVQLAGRVESTGMDRIAGNFEAICEQSKINLTGWLERSEGTIEAELTQLYWADPDRPPLALVEPSRITWSTVAGDIPWEQRLNVPNFLLRGPEMSVAFACKPHSSLAASLQNVSLFRLDRWLKTDLPQYQIDSIQAEISTLRPLVAGRLQIKLSEAVDSNTRIDLQLSAVADVNGITFEQLDLNFQQQPILHGHGSIPIQITLPATGKSSPFRVLADSAISGTLTGRSTTAFESWLKQKTAICLTSGRIDIDLQGELLDPSGTVHIAIDGLRTERAIGDYTLPELRDLKLNSRVDSNQLVLDQLSFLLRNSAVEGSLTLPLASLEQLFNDETRDLTAGLADLTGQLTVKDWRIENWTDYLPTSLRRSGILDGTLVVEPGLDLSGQLTFKELALRPIQSLPSIDSIQGRLKLENDRLTIESANAQFGGSRVDLAGEIDMTDRTEPLWNLTVAGLNVPMVRTKDMILRGDLDVKVATGQSSEGVLVSGKLNLLRSTLLVDFNPLAPNLAGSTPTRPPFFRITEAPFAEWRFDLKLLGDQFMRVRSPYFRTTLSANMDLKGSFANPELSGSVRNTGGELHFPGAKFSLDEGEAFIEAGRPDVVQLDFSGIAQKASRVIIMEVSQTLDDPRVQFQATPPMSNAAIVRFLATGSNSSGGLGNVGLYLGQGMLGSGSLNSMVTENLTVDIGNETTRSGRSLIGARYQISPQWAVEGDYDVNGAYNANLIWSIFKR